MGKGKGDGKNPKFRILCRHCNSYLHIVFSLIGEDEYAIVCRKCNNTANSFEEEFK